MGENLQIDREFKLLNLFDNLLGTPQAALTQLQPFKLVANNFCVCFNFKLEQ
ncbi:hypothetical protein Cha6605_4480 [Chamaesiphon minutus PCC 6605]|uniref:Uncharacterized protein n=1 Tax=Chamaesiphon minutus (strain ATCC 27169 / PCC 6605) TaxID=1173020 RepID=K9UMI9_CHAP6|nr:hypothetical protein Cha6605_4480 [Chamaesiphon minutus PCC 6605]